MVSAGALREALEELGVGKGSRLLIHSALQFLGLPEGGPRLYLETILNLVGPAGTVAVPTFNFGFARGEVYDPARTPSQGMGAFSELVRLHPLADRTSHPLQSLAVIGLDREDLCGRHTPGAFDAGSAFERMLELDYSLLLLGADIWYASIIHYSEQRCPVPYRSWKEFYGQVIVGGKAQAASCRMFVRDLDLNPRLDLKPVQALLVERGRWREIPLNYGRLASCRLVDFVKAADDLLAVDPWALVEAPPST